MRKYWLAIERRPHDYIPISWNLSIINDKKDINSVKNF